MAAWEHDLVELVETRGPALSQYAYLLCCDRAESADLVQEGLLRALSRIRGVRDVNRLEGYVRRAILNTYLDGRRRHRRWQGTEHMLVSGEESGPVDDAVANREAVRGALAGLSPRQRACVILWFYDDLSVAAIADELGCSEGTVKRHLSDGLARLNSSLNASEEKTAHDKQ